MSPKQGLDGQSKNCHQSGGGRVRGTGQHSGHWHPYFISLSSAHQARIGPCTLKLRYLLFAGQQSCQTLVCLINVVSLRTPTFNESKDLVYEENANSQIERRSSEKQSEAAKSPQGARLWPKIERRELKKSISDLETKGNRFASHRL